MTHLIQLARGSSGYQKILLTRDGVPKDPDHRRQAQEELPNERPGYDIKQSDGRPL